MYKTENFFDAEEIDGFYVTEERKKIWAAEIDLLDRFDEFCVKHSLKYFVGGGTLLGAVRHKGFIPWDDDIDTYMFRDEYNKLQEIIKKEPQDKYFIQSIFSEKDYIRTHTQFRNADTTAILKNEIDKNYRFNQGIFIDIFPVDFVPDDLKKRRKFLKKIDRLLSITYKYLTYHNYESHSFLAKIKHCAVSIIGMNRLLKHHDKFCQKFKNEKNLAGVISFQGSKRPLFEKEKIKSVAEYQFEYTKIKAIKEYDYYLKIKYGDNYMKPVNENSHHGEVFFDTERSYKFYLDEGRKELETYATTEY